jgi:hypothetical protein
MKTNKILIFFMIAICSCSKDNADLKPGYFIINYVDNKLKSSESLLFQTSKQDNSFDLGEIRKSEEFYFTLSNGGETPIFHISLNCDNSEFTLSPESIAMLDVIDKLTIQPILKVGALHGISIDGLGFAALMDKGENECILTIKGKTLSGSDTIEAKLDVKLKLYALVSDFMIHSQYDTIDFYNYDYFGAAAFEDSFKNSGIDKIRTYTYNNNNYKITNIGNVPLIISIFNQLYGSDPNFKIYYNKCFTLGIGETSDYLDLPYCQNNNVVLVLGLKINTQGTISDINRLYYGNDGNIYFVLRNYCE